MTLSEAPAHADTFAEAERRTSYIELFFDLVFVFAITQVATLLLEDLSAGGFARAALVLFLIWWAWGSYAWMTNAIHIDSFGVRIAFLAGTAASFFVALAVPHAFDREGAWFTVPFVFVRVLHVVLYTWGLRADPAHQAAIKQLAPWFLVAPAFILAGGLLPDPWRTWLWVTSIAIDVIGALSVGRAGFRISPAHFAERYGLFVIIALGESIVAIGVGAAELERDLTFAMTIVVAFAGVAALWWAYFEVPAREAERALQAAAPERRSPLARDVFSLFHYPIVLGIIFFAVAAKKALADPAGPLSDAGRWTLGLGIAIYLAGFILQRYRAVRQIAWEPSGRCGSCHCCRSAPRWVARRRDAGRGGRHSPSHCGRRSGAPGREGSCLGSVTARQSAGCRWGPVSAARNSLE
jgi:low temperature requirement protein LtrA